MRKILPPLIFFILLLAALEALTSLSILNPALIPPPHLILQSLQENAGDFRSAFFETFTATVIGLLASSALGFTLAIVFSLIPLVRRAVLPFAIFFQTVPIIAIAPLLVIYFGFGLGTVVTSALIVSIFPVLANTLLGLESVDPGYLELFHIQKASPWQILWKLRLPSAYSQIYAGLKVAIGLSVIGTIAGEFVAGGGLGSLIDSARTQQRLDLVYGALILLSLMGWFLILVLQLAQRLINAWRPYGLHLKDE